MRIDFIYVAYKEKAERANRCRLIHFTVGIAAHIEFSTQNRIQKSRMLVYEAPQTLFMQDHVHPYQGVGTFSLHTLAPVRNVSQTES